MDIESIRREKQRTVEQFGPWTAHNIQLAGDLYTIDSRLVGDEIKLRRIVQIVADGTHPTPFDRLRILDLACLEGLYAVEFARRGASVLGIEGRKANIEKARFAKNVLSLSNLDLVQEDVRNLSRHKHGAAFDVVLCLGILYHLDFPDVLSFLERIGEVCQRLVVVDTHVSPYAQDSRQHAGGTYWGQACVEHRPEAPPEEREKASWMSLDNPNSFWLTRPSLCNALAHAGFTSVFECYVPEEIDKPTDRITLLAIKGRREDLLSCPLMNIEKPRDLPERPKDQPAWDQRIGRRLARFLPRPIKELAKRWFALCAAAPPLPRGVVGAGGAGRSSGQG